MEKIENLIPKERRKEGNKIVQKREENCDIFFIFGGCAFFNQLARPNQTSYHFIFFSRAITIIYYSYIVYIAYIQQPTSKEIIEPNGINLVLVFFLVREPGFSLIRYFSKIEPKLKQRKSNQTN